MSTSIRSVFSGKYEVLKEIGRGGMSVVYLAMDKNLNKQWAIKQITKKAEDKEGDIYVQTLVTEANLMKRFDHPAIPRIVDIVENDEAIFVVMDYVEGESLDKVLKSFGPQPQDAVLDWTKQLADALNYLHKQKPPIIYRDMKPSNVMLKPEGTVKLIDFGTAREYKGSSVPDTVVLGTKGYAAPEQYGKRATDERTDIHCLGMTMHHLLTGQNPNSVDYEYHPVRYWNPNIHEGVERIIEKCVRPDPKDRYQNCTELLYALENYEYDTVEYRKQQKKKLAKFLVTASVGLLMLLVSLGCNIGDKIVKNNTYETLLNSEDYVFEIQIENYGKAIGIDSERLDAYEKMLEAYESRDSFGKEELLGTYFMKYTGDKATAEYVDMCYRIGYTFFHFYQEKDEEDSYQAKVMKSKKYFEEVHDIMSEHPEIEFKERDIAESYYVVTNFYKEADGLALTRAYSSEELNELLKAFTHCVEQLKSINENVVNTAQAIKLSHYKGYANQINGLRKSFPELGIDSNVVMQLLDMIESGEESITLGALEEERQKALDEIARVKEKILWAYELEAKEQEAPNNG